MENFSAAEGRLVDQGWQVVNPAKMGWVLPEDASWEDFMRMDFMLLANCSAIYMLKNWERSRGAKAEMAFAREHGIAIMYS